MRKKGKVLQQPQLGVLKVAGLARPRPKAAGEKQEQGFYRFKVLNPVLWRRNIHGLKLRSRETMRKIGGHH